ncbi:hypothetical protein BOTNAR_0219g00040 [Botryotinia narcissicola]|uniref:Uncharacterized protein n=1 Tax=Botryotinia narcissicola TaxID=278944 RepID=A0A4Z1I579_9HELO|nr:hypothetical protein BOTNAR_0219g00040 [Botryotinia narcissicola]
MTRLRGPRGSGFRHRNQSFAAPSQTHSRQYASNLMQRGMSIEYPSTIPAKAKYITAHASLTELVHLASAHE